MPRGVLATRILPILSPNRGFAPEPAKKGPKLFNAKRRIKSSRGLRNDTVREKLKKDTFNEEWRKHVSSDVSRFADDMEAQGMKLLPEEKLALVDNPARYFSRPQNVPISLRQQVYFPQFTVQLRRTEGLGPYYAQFYVPLWFAKMDLKSYLKQLYNVEVNHIRSFVVYRPVRRKRADNPYTRGPLFQLKQRKRMTVQLVEPFVWPQKPEEIDREEFGTSAREEQLRKRLEETKVDNDPFNITLDNQHRKSIAEQAKDVLEGKSGWAPTWSHFPEKNKVMQGFVPMKEEEVQPILRSISQIATQQTSPELLKKKWRAAFGEHKSTTPNKSTKIVDKDVD